MIKVTVITPFFNEEATLPVLFKKLSQVKIKGVIFELVFVNDGSTDQSLHLLERLLNKSKGKKGRVLSFRKNSGKGAAIKKGIQSATGEYILIQDADMEYHPRFIPRLLQPIIDGRAEVVFGSRLNQLPKFSGELRRPRFIIHYIGNRMLSLLTSMLYGAIVTDMETGYKVFPKDAIRPSTLRSKKFDIEPEITAKLLKGRYTIVEVPITTIPRGYKEGKKLRTIPDGIAALKALLYFRFYE